MRILLDTHTLIWWLTDNNRQLSRVARNAISDESNDIFVSAITAFEITIKHRLRKLAAANAFVDDVVAAIANEGFAELSLSLADAARAGALPDHHRDPFDRLLIAQAISNNLVFISNETLFDSYGIQRLW